MRKTLHAWFCCLLLSSAADALENQLANHASPYLAMHGTDPVHWQDWGDQVLVAARREDKLMFISSGYFACHWCHVMQQESYRNPEIAQLLNKHFIPVKLDRELHPALDAHLIDFVQQTQGRAGWPLNVFVTPEGFPLVGLAYAPSDRFIDILRHLVTLWDEKREPNRALAQRAMAAIRNNDAPVEVPADMAPTALRRAFVARALAIADDMTGGFGDQNRFPMAPQLLALMEMQSLAANSDLADFLKLTLDQMASQGLRDHLGGGFFRYTVDPNWQVPHYEKMLYTQALLAQVYLAAAAVFEHSPYAAVAEDTLDFVLRHLAAAGGGYIASLSAVDGAGKEGGAYLWSDDQLGAVLNADELSLARPYWSMQGNAPTEGGYLPRRVTDSVALAKASGIEVSALASETARLRDKLINERLKRDLPRDEKVIVGWNGLLLAVLAEAGEQLDAEPYRRAAGELGEFLMRRYWNGERLLRARGEQGAIGTPALEDYAYLSLGLDRLAGLQGNGRAATVRDELLGAAWRDFHTPGKGWRAGGTNAQLPAMASHRAMRDGPMPSPAAVVVGLSLRSGSPVTVELARSSMLAAKGSVYREPLWHATDVAIIAGKGLAVTHSRAVSQ